MRNLGLQNGVYMSLDKAMQNLKLDSRLVEFNIRTGQITKEDLQKHLANLPDLAQNCEKINIEENHERSSSEQH